jgi:hypothetical protein
MGLRSQPKGKCDTSGLAQRVGGCTHSVGEAVGRERWGFRPTAIVHRLRYFRHTRRLAVPRVGKPASLSHHRPRRSRDVALRRPPRAGSSAERTGRPTPRRRGRCAVAWKAR